MATVTAQLTLTSNTSTSDALNLILNDTLTTKEPVVGISRVSVATISYVYLKNTDPTNIIVVKNDAGQNISYLGPGEFAWFPLKGATGLECTAVTAACVLEYAYWTKG